MEDRKDSAGSPPEGPVEERAEEWPVPPADGGSAGDGECSQIPALESLDGDGELEELVLAADVEEDSPGPGDSLAVGDENYAIEEPLPRGYIRARRECDDLEVVLRHRPLTADDYWRNAPRHPRLPEILYAGEDGLVLERIAGTAVEPPVSLAEAVSLLHGVAQLMRFLAVKEMAVVDIDPASLILEGADGLRLQFLPGLAPLGDPAHVVGSDGVTPIHGSETDVASEATSVFLWGALLHRLVTGRDVPAEGLYSLLLGQLNEPGLPQLLHATMQEEEAKRDLRSLSDAYTVYRRRPVPLYRLGAATSVGLNPTRICNEDSYVVTQQLWESHELQLQLIRACVADGMGGEEAGEAASHAAVHVFSSHPAPPRLDAADEQVKWTRELGWKANQAVFSAVGDRGGGCTLTGIVLVNERLTLAHVGDSRAYLHSPDDGLQPLSRDHSLVRSLMDSGALSEEEAVSRADTNQVTRALGTVNPEAVHEDYIDGLSNLTDSSGESLRGPAVNVKPDSLVLLMTDGIWGSWEYKESVIEAELTAAIEAACGEPQAIADQLLSAALEAGADDNATVVVMRRVR